MTKITKKDIDGQKSGTGTGTGVALKLSSDQEWKKAKKKIKRLQTALPNLKNAIDGRLVDRNAVMESLRLYRDDRSGKSTNTQIMLASCINSWIKYCDQVGSENDTKVFAFPMNEDVALSYFRGMFLDGKKVTTIRQHRAQLLSFSLIIDIESPIKNNKITAFFNSLSKDYIEYHNTDVMPTQAKPLNEEHLKALSKVYRNDNAIQCRDLTLLAIAYGTSMRISEIREITLGRVRVMNSGEVRILRLKSKTVISPLPKSLDGWFAKQVIYYLHKYCHASRPNDPIFYSIGRSGGLPKYMQDKGNKERLKKDASPLSYKNTRLIFKRADAAVGGSTEFMDYTRDSFSAHSTRVGSVQDAAIKGATAAQQQRMGDWSSAAMPAWYTRMLDMQSDGHSLIQSEFDDDES